MAKAKAKAVSIKPQRSLRMQTIYLRPDQVESLDALAKETRIAKAVLLREAVDDLLAKHRKLLNVWEQAAAIQRTSRKAKSAKSK